jgi:hypothetical protein
MQAGLAVDAVLLAHRLEHAVQRALADASAARVGQVHRVELAHQIAEHRTLPATGGDDAARRLGVDLPMPWWCTAAAATSHPP